MPPLTLPTHLLDACANRKKVKSKPAKRPCDACANRKKKRSASQPRGRVMPDSPSIINQTGKKGSNWVTADRQEGNYTGHPANA
eukprot:1065831-Pelagomonas_calceolata.AAC.4